MINWRVHFALHGLNDSHVRCQIFCATYPSVTFANCGEIVVRRGEEFASFLRAFSGAEFLGDNTGITAACNAESEQKK